MCQHDWFCWPLALRFNHVQNLPQSNRKRKSKTKVAHYLELNCFAKWAYAVNFPVVIFFIHRSGLRDIYDKVVAGERISEADALRLFESKDLNAIGAIADFVRQKKTGNNRASYIINRYINYSNYCILSCQFCSFAVSYTHLVRAL